MKLQIILLLAAALCGCASAPKNTFSPISTETAAALRDGAVAVEVFAGKGFSHSTRADQALMSSGMLFGAIGGAIGAAASIANANRRGGKLARESALADPSLAVGDKLRSQIDAGRATPAEPAIRLRLNTTQWALSPANVAYFSTLQVVDRAGTVRARGECKYVRTLSELGTDGDALLANAGAGLKDAFAVAADHCADYFGRTLLAPQG